MLFETKLSDTKIHFILALQWLYNERDGISNDRRLDSLLNCLLRHRLKKTSKLRITGLCEENPPVTSVFPSQRASNADNVSIWWRHRENFGIFPGSVQKNVSADKSCYVFACRVPIVPDLPRYWSTWRSPESLNGERALGAKRSRK